MRSTSGRAGSSSTRGRRASSSTTSGSSPSSPSRLSGACRSSSTAGGACRRSPSISAGSTRRTRRRSLIIAHAGIADLAALSECFAGRPGVYFDTSVWSVIDLLDMFARVSPGQVLYASDYPYGQQPGSLLLAVRTALLAGLTEDELRDMLGRSAARIADGEPPAPLVEPRGLRRLDQPLTFARIHHYLAMATPLLWTRQADTIGVLGLALNACAERDGYVEERERIAELLSAARDLWRTLPEAEDETEVRTLSRATFRLLHIADILTLTLDPGH